LKASDPRSRINSFLHNTRPAQALFLAELVKIPTDNPPGDCEKASLRATELLRELGFAVEPVVIPPEQVRANGMVSCTNLVVRARFGESGPTVACNAHGDVVPPGLGWTRGPYSAEVDDGFMYGRGAAVSKSDFVTYAYALLALKEAARVGASLDGSVELHFTYDEEVGGEIGPAWLLSHGITKPDFAISAGFSYGVVTAHNGVLHLEVQLTGTSAHAAEPDSGDDALEAAVAIAARLYALRKSYASVTSKVPGISHPTLVIGRIEGGINTNVVPDRVTFRLDRRIIPEEDPEEVEATLLDVISDEATRWPAINCVVRRILLATPFAPVAGQERLVGLLQKNAREVFGEDIEAHGSRLFTDARHYSAARIPTVLYGAGPRTVLEANGHRADERIRLDDLYRATEVVALTLLDLLAK
jgi:acetylornithine deacetylase/succinyl-diaminopimelate desuccinylase-like protein